MDIQLGLMIFILSIALSIPIILLNTLGKRGQENKEVRK